MFEFVVTILIFVAVIAITAVVFGGWVIVTVLRTIGRVVFGPPAHRDQLTGGATSGLICPRHKCRAKNPPEARFCRRCGAPMPTAQRVAVRRAAVV